MVSCREVIQGRVARMGIHDSVPGCGGQLCSGGLVRRRDHWSPAGIEELDGARVMPWCCLAGTCGRGRHGAGNRAWGGGGEWGTRCPRRAFAWSVGVIVLGLKRNRRRWPNCLWVGELAPGRRSALDGTEVPPIETYLSGRVAGLVTPRCVRETGAMVRVVKPRPRLLLDHADGNTQNG